MALPIITGANKVNVIYGELVTISGSGLLYSKLYINGRETYIANKTVNELSFLVPINLELGINSVYVINDDGQSNTIELKIGISPVILNVTSNRLISGDEITITGEFLDSSSITFDGELITTNSNTGSLIKFNTPNRPIGKYDVLVSNDFGTATTVIEIGELPIINSSDKISAKINEIVTFNIDNFIGSSRLTINNEPLQVVYRDSIQISAIIPLIGYGTYDVIASNGFGDSLPYQITVVEGAPYIQSIAPKKGAVNSVVIINGFNFINADIEFNNITIIADYKDDSTIEIIVPEFVNDTYNITLSNSFGSTTSEFTIIDSPEITSICPRVLDYGDTMTIHGYNLLNSANSVNILFDGITYGMAQFDSISDTKIEFTIPTMEYNRYMVSIDKDGKLSNSQPVIIGNYNSNITNDGESCKQVPDIYYKDTAIYTKPGIYDDYIYVNKIISTNIDIITGGELVIEGYQLIDGDIVSLEGQSNSSENGIYEVKENTWKYIRSSSNLYIDSDVGAYDIYDGDISREVVVDSCDIDFSSPGVYNLCYYIINSSGILNKKCRKIKIMTNGSSILPTTITRISDYKITSEFNTKVINDLIKTNR